MPNRNPNKPHRHIEANQRKTEKRIEEYYGVLALLMTWEQQPEDVQIREHDYIIRLRAKVRMNKNYLMNRADPKTDGVKCS